MIAAIFPACAAPALSRSASTMIRPAASSLPGSQGRPCVEGGMTRVRELRSLLIWGRYVDIDQMLCGPAPFLLWSRSVRRIM